MKLTYRQYRPFNLDGSPYEFVNSDKRIAYDARTFEWVDTPVESPPPVPYNTSISDIENIFKRIDRIAEGADCERRRMGCYVVSSDGAFDSTGFNDKPEGVKGACKVVGCIPALTCRLTLHAEQVALMKMPDRAVRNGLYLFNSGVCCLDCAKVALAKNVKAIFYKEERPQPEYDRPILAALTMFGGIKFVKVSE
jgi:deoxycytidylate deaminase